MPSYRCQHPTCGALLPRPGWCPDHAGHEPADEERQHDPGRRQRKAVYDSSRWRKARRFILAEHPVCQVCGREFSHHIDHTPPLRVLLSRGADPCDPKYLTALCGACHSAKTRRETAGTGGW